MPENLQKLSPHRDLQCYFLRPSAIAAMSQSSDAGFVLSGSWRQQFDWAVVEWNRDNTFEHPLFRYLPDGDLSGLQLSYEETRTNCIAIDANLYPTVDWPYLRIWATSGGTEEIYKVTLADHKTVVDGEYVAAYVDLTLSGTPTAGDYVGFGLLTEHYTYQLRSGDSFEAALSTLMDAVNDSRAASTSLAMRAEQSGNTIRLYYVGPGHPTVVDSTFGRSGNRAGVYTYLSGSTNASWNVPWADFAGGTSPTKWRIDLDFRSLTDSIGRTVPTANVRKMRWTYSADQQPGEFVRTEFSVVVSAWAVAGTHREYLVAGPGSQRIENDDLAVQYSGEWLSGRGNYSSGSIAYVSGTAMVGSALHCSYQAAMAHSLFVGTRLTPNGATIHVVVDGLVQSSTLLSVPAEDVLVRHYVGEFSAGNHTVTLTHAGPQGADFFFDFLEAAMPVRNLPATATEARITLATDWDTDHSIALPAERTAWMLDSLGFKGRANHYVGALWFYEMARFGHNYASGLVMFVGVPVPNQITTLTIGRTDQPTSSDAILQHVNVIGDSAETIAKAFEQELNNGYNSIHALCANGLLTISSRSMGLDGNAIRIEATPVAGAFTATTSGPTLVGGVDGFWRTDLTASPRLNRAARDWMVSYFTALRSYGIDGSSAFSTELHAEPDDPFADSTIAQRYPDGAAVVVNTPALQSNFSLDSLTFWRDVYADTAGLQVLAGCTPYVQFGEVQWWYFEANGGMPFYDSYTKIGFESRYGREISTITTHSGNPELYPNEMEFLPKQIGDFTSRIISYVRAIYPDCRFEVLYPTDVNNTALNATVNYPRADWTPATLTCLKTESFGYTGSRNLNLSQTTVQFGTSMGFPSSKRSHLVGISDPTTAWVKEARMAEGMGFESVVLFALDQFALIGYALPLSSGLRRALYLG